ATHKHPKVQAWLKKHPRFHMHFTPTSSSWLNVIERWFKELTDKQLRRGVFRSVAELIETIEQFVAHHNAEPHGFVWTKKAEDILAKVTRARAALDKTPSA
ncbi:MAG: transposase, partial [Planctomycetaceae bacterium]|nr:transposase [Planctomycetaceae bacterium]